MQTIVKMLVLLLGVIGVLGGCVAASPPTQTQAPNVPATSATNESAPTVEVGQGEAISNGSFLFYNSYATW